MAPRKSNAKASAATPKPVQDRKARVSKRRSVPLRFHKNGVLDVAQRASANDLLIQKRNQQDSPLLRLAPELRNMIYGLVLGGESYYLKRDMKPTPHMLCAHKSPNALALLQVCRQIYTETALLPFALNTFRMYSVIGLKCWTKYHPMRNHMQSLDIEEEMYERGNSPRNCILNLDLSKFPYLKKLAVTVRLLTTYADNPMAMLKRAWRYEEKLVAHMKKNYPQVQFESKVLDY